MTTKNSRRRAALDRARAEAAQRYPDPTTKAGYKRSGFIAGVMWHREHPWHEDTQPTEQEHSNG